MLSRSAEGLYWMGRYLERARHLSRLLQLQTAALVDRPVREIYFGWSRIYTSLGREPPGGSLEINDDDDFILADSFTLADDLTFERSNPGSVWQCFWMGRENARQMRNRISGEMWTSLNEGVAQTTMYRDDGWRFMQLGRSVERAQLLVSLLLAHMATQAASEEASDDDWSSLLRICNALDAYGQKYGLEMQGCQVLDLLVADLQLPGSLCRSFTRAAEGLMGVGPASDQGSGAAVLRLARRLGALVDYEWPDQQDPEAFLRQVSGHCLDLHDAVSSTYFHYQLG